ncbi:MAG TPA: hypothetical protein VLI06_13460 [Solimonas sp.]|nr:hypothetical protein [Solimonas sp.]
MFGRMKDAALGMALRAFINERLSDYGEIQDLKVDTGASRLKMHALLRGEQHPVSVTVERYELEREGDEVYVVLRQLSSSREWLTLLLRKLFTGKRYKIPAAAAALLG